MVAKKPNKHEQGLSMQLQPAKGLNQHGKEPV